MTPRVPIPLRDDEAPGWGAVACPKCAAEVRHLCFTKHGTRKVPHRARVAAVTERHLHAHTGTRRGYVGPRAWYDPAQAADEFALDADLAQGTQIKIIETSDRAGKILTGSAWLFTVLGVGVKPRKPSA